MFVREPSSDCAHHSGSESLTLAQLDMAGARSFSFVQSLPRLLPTHFTSFTRVTN